MLNNNCKTPQLSSSPHLYRPRWPCPRPWSLSSSGRMISCAKRSTDCMRNYSDSRISISSYRKMRQLSSKSQYSRNKSLKSLRCIRRRSMRGRDSSPKGKLEGLNWPMCSSKAMEAQICLVFNLFIILLMITLRWWWTMKICISEGLKIWYLTLNQWDLEKAISNRWIKNK